MESIVIDRSIVDSLKSLLVDTTKALKQSQEREKANYPMTLQEAAAYLKITKAHLHTLRTEGEIVVSKYGGNVWIMKADLDSFLKRHRVE